MKLTTFITPWGRYRYLRNTMGYHSAGDEFNIRMDKAFEGIANYENVVDCIVYNEDYNEHQDGVKSVLQRCREH